MNKSIVPSRMSLLLVGAVALVCSCQDYEPFSEQVVQDKAYTHEFEKLFGNIDPNQDWDLFGQLARGHRTKGTRAALPSEVKVETEDYYLRVTQEDATEYEKVLPESDTNPRPKSETNLGRVTQDFVATAREFSLAQVHYYTSGIDAIGIYWYADAGDEGAITLEGSDGETYYIQRKEIYVNKTGVKGIKLMSYYTPIDIVWDDFDDLQNYAPDRYVIADGTQYNQWGGAWEIGTKIFDTGETNSNDQGQTYKVWDYFREGPSYFLPDVIKADMRAIHQDYQTADGSDNYKDQWGNTINGGYFVTFHENEEVEVGQGGDERGSENYFLYGNADYLRCQIIHVEVPDDIPYYGFYITNGHQYGSGTRYSEANLNDPVTFSDAGTEAGHFVATFDISDIDPSQESQRYLCFEDWMAGATNFDLNDLVFTISLDPESIIDHDESNEYALLVCEDLKDYDFDFNDVVLLLNYSDGVSRTYNLDGYGNVLSVDVTPDVPKLSITALAAGGAFESNISINYKKSDTQTLTWNLGEIHALLNEAGGPYDAHHHSIINAGSAYGSIGQVFTIEGKDNLPPKNVMPDGTYSTYLSQLFDTEGFFKIVCDEDREAVQIVSGSYDEGSAPQMMLLPEYFEWPQEKVYIKDAYDDFELWAQDVTQTQWIISSQIEKYITDRGDLWTEVNQGIEVGKKTLPVTNGEVFTYKDKHGVITTYQNCAKVDFTYFQTEFTLESEDYAKLTITYTTKPDATVYLDFADGSQFMEDKRGTETSHTYQLAKSQLQKAVSTGYIYFMAPNSADVVIESAELSVYR